jgi:hypothetical protein
VSDFFFFSKSCIIVGGWPATQNIQQITKIVVHFGEILDGLEITYKTPSGLKTVQHGGKGGNEKVLDFKGTMFDPGLRS